METVLTAAIVLFVILFALFSIGNTMISSFEMLTTAQSDVSALAEYYADTHLSFLDAYSSHYGSQIHLLLKNDGDTRLFDFSRWDAIIHYFDTTLADNYHINWFSFAPAIANPGQWQVDGIYMNVLENQAELFEPTILNPQEDIVLTIMLAGNAAGGSPAQAILSTENGQSISYIFHINRLPELSVNNGMTVIAGSQKTINTSMLEAIDADDLASEVIFSVVTAPQQGILSIPGAFSQQDIANGLVTYTYTGSGDDSFEFNVTDGKDTIGVYEFEIQFNDAPTVATNSVLTLPVGATVPITSALLQIADVDTPAENLIITIVQATTSGYLNLGYTFPQSDIDLGALTYTHTDSTTTQDSFTFTVSDGENQIGPFTFVIQPQ
jgi:hypothetical protein